MNDGVIKYRFKAVDSNLIDSHLFIEIEKLRERLFALGFIGEKDGIGFGNISQRIDTKTFVITGTQTGYLANLQAKDYTLVHALDYQNFHITYSGATKPSSEAFTHGSIYQLDPNINAVIHIHSKALWSFMLQNDYLKTENVAYGTREMTEEVKRIYTNKSPLEIPMFVMSGHEEGIIIFGDTITNAELNLLHIIKDYI